MIALKAIRALGPIDLKNVRRDPLLRWMVFIPLILIAVTRWLIPWLAGQVRERFGFDLAPYFPLFMSFITLAVPLILGMVIGFLLLDQRDDNTLTALQVTPLSLDGYLIYRVAMPALVTFGMTALVIVLGGLAPLDAPGVALVALAAAPWAPIMALFYASVAQNKVQGFAVNKGSGVILLPALVAYFVPPAWQNWFIIAPTYAPARLFWTLSAGQPGAGGWLLISLVYEAVLLAIMLRIFKRVMTR